MSDHESVSENHPSVFATPQYMQTAATVLGLSIQPEWESSVLTNLDLLETAAEQVLSFDLPDDVESAVMFITR